MQVMQGYQKELKRQDVRNKSYSPERDYDLKMSFSSRKLIQTESKKIEDFYNPAAVTVGKE